MVDRKLSAIIGYKLPSFIRDDNEMYVAFIKAYIEFLEQEGNALHYLQRFQRNLDPDMADPDFLERYREEFANTFPQATQVPTSQLLKLMREFYLSKGSEDSFRFIFTILYGVDVDIIYPREFLYVPSSGEYGADVIANITGTNFFKLAIDNSDLNATIEGVDSGAGAVIDTITSTYLDGVQILQLEISSYDGQFTPGEEITLTVDDVQYTETMLGAITRITVEDGGTNYSIDDPIVITDVGGKRAKAKIRQLDKGEINVATIIDGGSGYAVGDTIKASKVLNSNGYGFHARVAEVDGSGAITKVRIKHGGYDYSAKANAIIKSDSGTGASIELNGDAIGKIKEIEVFDGGLNYQNSGTISINIQSSEGTGAVLTPVIGGVFTTPKRYQSQKSTPSGSSKLLDSFYYQQYSYVLASEVSPHKWIGQVKRIAHPAGTQLFGMYRLENEFDLDLAIAPTSSTIAYSLALFNEQQSAYPTESEYNRTLKFSVDDVCSVGNRLKELDFVKFSPTFNWTVGDFGNYTLNDVYGDCNLIMNEQESSEITITPPP